MRLATSATMRPMVEGTRKDARLPVVRVSRERLERYGEAARRAGADSMAQWIRDALDRAAGDKDQETGQSILPTDAESKGRMARIMAHYGVTLVSQAIAIALTYLDRHLQAGHDPKGTLGIGAGEGPLKDS